MDLPLSRLLVPRLRLLEECGSTNTELATAAARRRLPDFSVFVTTKQTGGRGRMGRTWVAPPGQTLAVSVLVRPAASSGAPLEVESFGWLPLIAGIAMTRAVAALVPTLRDTISEEVKEGTDSEEAGQGRLEGAESRGHRVSLKWPNDVLIDGRKVAGLLAELLPVGKGVVLGAGLNLTIAARDLPTPTSTSLTLNSIPGRAGGPASGGNIAPDALVDAALANYLTELRSLYDELLSDGVGGIRLQLLAECDTVGRRVRVELPGGGELVGRAVDVDESGRLCVESASDGRVQAVAAGDVTHVR